MPHLINGCGTWYFGKREIHRLKGTCEFCHRAGELESYDTTLYLTLIFMPTLPLTHKRILAQCPSCKKHRVLPLKTWRTQKQQAIAKVMEKLEKDSDDPAAIVEAIGMACSFQDGALFEQVASTLANHRLKDAAIQRQVGGGYAYFARWPEAEKAYRAALAAEDQPEVRRQLGLALLKQGKPEEAAPYLQHILDERLREQARLIYLLVEGYQAEGMHRQALELLEQADEAFPELVDDKWVKARRKISQRYEHSGKKIAPSVLSESGQTGYSKGNWTARLPRLVLPAALLIFICWYLITAMRAGQSQKVYLVNGVNRPYTVAIAGNEFLLQADSVAVAHVPEGEVNVEIRDAAAGAEPLQCKIETPFLTRPFKTPTFVINPDRLAVLARQQNEYAVAPRPAPPPQVFSASLFYSFEGVDYEFVPFPDSIKIDRGKSVIKTGLTLVQKLSPEARVAWITELLKPDEQMQYARRWLSWNPQDWITLSWLLNKLQPEEALAFLRGGFEARPIRVNWHRLYQDIMHRSHPEVDLVPTYRRLAAQTNEEPDAVYLLARSLENNDAEADKLLRQAATAMPPSPYALNGLAYNELVQGHFPQALIWSEKAVQAAPQELSLRQAYEDILLAAGQFDRLAKVLEVDRQTPIREWDAIRKLLLVYSLQGQRPKVEAAINDGLRKIQGPQARETQELWRTAMELEQCYAENDVAGFLRRAPKLSGEFSFESNFLQGKLDEAARVKEPDEEKVLLQQALLYLAYDKTGKQKPAQEQWQFFLTKLGKDRSPLRTLGDILAGRRPVNIDEIRRLKIVPAQKRVLLAVVAKRYPATAKDLFKLARHLDYNRDAISLCLRQIIG